MTSRRPDEHVEHHEVDADEHRDEQRTCVVGRGTTIPRTIAEQRAREVGTRAADRRPPVRRSRVIGDAADRVDRVPSAGAPPCRRQLDVRAAWSDIAGQSRAVGDASSVERPPLAPDRAADVTGVASGGPSHTAVARSPSLPLLHHRRSPLRRCRQSPCDAPRTAPPAGIPVPHRRAPSTTRHASRPHGYGEHRHRQPDRSR